MLGDLWAFLMGYFVVRLDGPNLVLGFIENGGEGITYTEMRAR